MAFAKMCDRCHKMGTHAEEDVGPKGWAALDMIQYDPKLKTESSWSHDLCPECAVEVHKFLANEDYPEPEPKA